MERLYPIDWHELDLGAFNSTIDSSIDSNINGSSHPYLPNDLDFFGYDTFDPSYTMHQDFMQTPQLVDDVCFDQGDATADASTLISSEQVAHDCHDHESKFASLDQEMSELKEQLEMAMEREQDLERRCASLEKSMEEAKDYMERLQSWSMAFKSSIEVVTESIRSKPQLEFV